jgi:general secretion pathway protein G
MTKGGIPALGKEMRSDSQFLSLIKSGKLGFSLIELLIVIVILSAIAVIAVPSYQGYVDRSKVAKAMGDILEIQLVIARFVTDKDGKLPDTLADVRKNGVLDPWGNPYVYTNLITANTGDARKDKKLNPINSDYDLYSMGKDGVTKKQLDNKDSLDDVVRANDGGYVGLAAKYNN